ncbi:MAG: hypothetical protein H7Z15_04715 [Rhizobacter sp.]|nr:hypothetical protein [Rhizobacter sp.]
MTPTHLPWRALAALLAAAALATACGGVDSGGTGQTAQTTSTGRISGFGSVIVNGVRYDDSQANIVDDDGALRSRSDLKLGMVVEVTGERRGNSGTGVAYRIQYGNEIAGPVESVDVLTSQLVVLGQRVRVDVDTIFDGHANGLAGVLAGDLIEVFAFYDITSEVYTATRIERRATLAAYKLRGRISALDTVDNHSFSIGSALIDYGSIAPPALPRLANGLSVRVTLQNTPVAGRWVASSVHTSQRNFPEAREAELEGFISGFVSSASFSVAGIPVDASAPGVRFRHGNLNDLANGVRVEVEGVMRTGVLVASEVDFKRGGDQEFELNGAIESVNTPAQTFVLRGVTVTYDNRTVFAAGREVNLLVGARVEVRGAPSAGGVGLQARQIRFER